MRRIFAITLVIIFILVFIVISQFSNQSASENTANIIKTDIATQSNPEPDSNQNTVICDNFLKRSEIENCLSNVLDQLNSKLEDEIKNYAKDIKTFHSAKDLSNLNKSQKLWLSYRQKNCQAEKELYGEGTDAVMASLSCEINLTDERGKELRRIYGRK